MSVKIIKYGDPYEGAQDGIDNGNLALIMRVTSQAKELAPEDTGDLKGSIMWKVPGKQDGHERGPVVQEEPRKNEGLVGTAMEYAGYVEFGTKYQEAQPYLRPAVTLEVFGPNGMNILSKEVIDAMAKNLSQKGAKSATK